MVCLTIDGQVVEVPQGTSVLQACQTLGIEIPVFCYHPQLSIAGNCRMCLVEMEKSPKPIASCSFPVAPGMVIHTQTPLVQKARQGVLELLLINHPLDCPICDQGGECDLQDITTAYGPCQTRYTLDRRIVGEKDLGPLIKTAMTRCIHCTRCIRFSHEVAGTDELAALHRGEHTEIVAKSDGILNSELSGNLVDICPVGALVNGPYSFRARPWELTSFSTIDVTDACGTPIKIDVKKGQKTSEIMRVLPAKEGVWIHDKTRFSYDGLTRQRLDHPYGRSAPGAALTPLSWSEALSRAAQAFTHTPPSRIGILVGDQVDCETMMALKDFATALKIPHMDCRQEGASLDATPRYNYLFNTPLEEIQRADEVLLVGTHPRREAPLINALLLKATLAHPGRTMVSSLISQFSPHTSSKRVPIELTYPHEFLGDDPRVLVKILKGDHPLSERLHRAERPLIVVGQGALARPDGQIIFELCQHIARHFGFVTPQWQGWNILPTAASRVGGMDLNILPQPEGLNTRGMLSAAQQGDLTLLYLVGADELPSEALDKICQRKAQDPNLFIIYQGSHGDRGAHWADLILPGVSFIEKEATFVNLEGKRQRTTALFPPMGEARLDWKIVSDLSDACGHPLYETESALQERLCVALDEAAHCSSFVPSVMFNSFVQEKKPLSDSDLEMFLKKLSPEPLTSVISDFYGTDPVSRQSSLMALCRKAHAQKGYTALSDGAILPVAVSVGAESPQEGH